jgi:energy-coupling factor transport system ATP-binding protein
MSVLELTGVTYAYPDAPPSLRDVTLTIEPGEFVVLAGGSGSGKSTLLRAAAGLVPHFHGGTFAGRLSTGGLDTRHHGPAALSTVAGTLFQDPETQVIMGTVRSELAFPLENRGWGGAAVARGVEEAALALGIAPLLDRSTRELSGGELQRVALGAALAGRPRLLLLDEPTSQLDPVAGDELLGVLRRVNEEWGTAVLLAEHRLERCLPAADRVVALEGGALAFDGTPEDFLRRRAETPIARLFALAGRPERPVTVKAARTALSGGQILQSSKPETGAARMQDLTPREPGTALAARGRGDARLQDLTPVAGGWRRRRGGPPAAVALERVWLERDAAILRGVDLRIGAGDAVALMGRNGAGKSSLLKVAAGLWKPTRGKVTAAGRVALLLQNPGDYLLEERVDRELPAPELEAAGLGHLAARHPRDLSGGERQRLALEIVLRAAGTPAAVCLDEPTRGMDRGHKERLARRLRELAAGGTAVVVATHDAEFSAAFAARTVLLGDGRPVADAPTAEVLGGGWYFATQTARVLGQGALTPEQGAALIADLAVPEVPA